MSCLAFPLRLRQGLLQKTTEQDSFEDLLAIMAATPDQSWVGDPHFGFREYFASSAARKDLPEPMIEDQNKALQNLGLSHFVILSVKREIIDNEEAFRMTYRRDQSERSFWVHS
jgi:hypothetical protein